MSALLKASLSAVPFTRGRSYCECPHFTDGETKAERSRDLPKDTQQVSSKVPFGFRAILNHTLNRGSRSQFYKHCLCNM